MIFPQVQKMYMLAIIQTYNEVEGGNKKNLKLCSQFKPHFYPATGYAEKSRPPC